MIIHNENAKNPFQEHNKRMRVFCKSHDRTLVAKTILRNSLSQYQAARTVTDIKEPDYLNGTIDYPALKVMPKILLLRSQQN